MTCLPCGFDLDISFSYDNMQMPRPAQPRNLDRLTNLRRDAHARLRAL